VSITSPQDQRLRYLMQTRARIRWVSYEPMLAPVNWRPWLGGDGRVGLDWIIVGGVSGPDYRSQIMNLKWLEDTVKQCRDANVALFVKQDSDRSPGQQGRIPHELWVREFPKISRIDLRPKGFGLS
jgi:protein gp37